MQWFFIFLVIPILWIIFAKIFFHTFTWKEAGIQFAVSIAMCIALALLTISSRYVGTMDTELLNGQVVDKYSERVSCEHSYSCNCTTDSKGNTSCQTCYEHSFDMNWIVDTTVGSLAIDRINRQGTREPPRFSSVVLGEPASLENRYTNYIKAVPESVFNVGDFASTKPTVSYPRVHDYYHVRHVLDYNSGVSRALRDTWDAQLKQTLMRLGAQKQVNILLVTVSGEQARSYADELEYHWLRGKKNDVVVVMSVGDEQSIKWVRSFGWSKTSRVFHELEQQLTNTNANEETVDIITNTVQEYYIREPFEQYSYLMAEVSPPLWAIILLFILNMGITGGVGYYFVTHDTGSTSIRPNFGFKRRRKF